MPPPRAVRIVAGCLALVPLFWCLAGENAKPRKPRVKPPEFAERESAEVFFPDVFAVLVGPRPDLKPASSTPAGPTANVPTPVASPMPGTTPVAGGWSSVVSAATLENEIKAIKQLVDQDVSTPGDFKGRGYKVCRTHFSVAAALFGVIHEYDAEVRWKADAAAARDAFARTAANAKVGTSQVFNEARQRKTELADLLAGNSFPGEAAEDPNDWSKIADRGPLMQRLEAGFDNQVRKLTASQGEFASNKDKLRHEAELIAAIAAMLVKPGMEDGDDSSYAAQAQQMKEGARAIVDGVQQGNYEQARQAVGLIDKACSACHEDYRG